MSRYEPFGELYDNRPILLIRDQLKNCASVLTLATQAKEKGFDVEFTPGGFINDIVIKENRSTSAAGQNHTVRSAKRFIESY